MIYGAVRIGAALWVAACAAVAPPATEAPAAAGFDFARTVRVDYFHSGGPAGERFALDAVVAEGAWPGSRTQLVDPTGLGEYAFDVIDRASGRVIYSRGFASIYGEWETIPESRTTNRTFHESLRFPRPLSPVGVVVKKRDRQRFRPVWRLDVDPRTAVARAAPAAGTVTALADSGPAATKVDLLLLSEGYAANELASFRADAERLVEALFALEPFRTRRGDFNIRTLALAGAPLSVEFNIFGLERYALTYDNRALRDAAAAAPYDVLQILVNERRFGGGGIFNQQSTVAAPDEAADYVFIHELAHNLAGLADEYVGNVTYQTGAPVETEPWEPNITALVDPAALKWRDLVEPGTPIPTPPSFAGRVGAYEGARYEARGLFRPEAVCIMGTREVVDFCRVCRRAIDRAIDLHVN